MYSRNTDDGGTRDTQMRYNLSTPVSTLENKLEWSRFRSRKAVAYCYVQKPLSDTRSKNVHICNCILLYINHNGLQFYGLQFED